MRKLSARVSQTAASVTKDASRPTSKYRAQNIGLLEACEHTLLHYLQIKTRAERERKNEKENKPIMAKGEDAASVD